MSEYTGYISNTRNYLMKNIHVSFPEYGCKSSRTCSYALRTTDYLNYVMIMVGGGGVRGLASPYKNIYIKYLINIKVIV